MTTIANIQAPAAVSQTTDYSYNPANNQLIGSTGTAPKTCTFDANGNMVSDGTLSLIYDGLNRMIQAMTPTATTVATGGYERPSVMRPSIISMI